MFEQRPAACDSEQEARLELRGPSLNPDRQTLRTRQAGPRMPWKENSTEGWGPGAAGPHLARGGGPQAWAAAGQQRERAGGGSADGPRLGWGADPITEKQSKQKRRCLF